MPSWGRPSGAHKGKREKGRDRQIRRREEARRFEEIESDDDDGQGVGLSRQYVGDELYFTGADLSRSRPRNQRTRSHDTSESSEADDVDENIGGIMQLALRDKEESLVHKALERIRRAQMLGRTNVKLTQSEIDALARKRRKDEATRKAPLSSSSAIDRRPGSTQLSDTVEQRPSNRRLRNPRSTYRSDEFPGSRHATLPEILLPGTDGKASYQAFGQYSSAAPGQHNRSPRSGSRSASSHSQLQSTPPLPSSQFRSPKERNFSVPETSRPPPTISPNSLPRRLPDDPNWIPRPQSSSSNPAQIYSPPSAHVPSHYFQGRRIVSGPPELQYMGSRRGGDSSPIPYPTSSEPSHMHREHSGRRGDDFIRNNDDTEDDDDDYGVQVDVVPYGQGY
ncbi:hypothetical protein MMC07_009232 [Pseudocyphellaria aurata]|nr:hypothetical protein [Pseudocyphellaria aurata]